jgi:glycosyltransferase involved in cell wall biosynthesis
MLLDRCIPSVAAQTYQHLEHIVVSDGPDAFLAQRIASHPDAGRVRFAELPAHDVHPQNWGSAARNHGLTLASGELVAYLDDDNAWRSNHLKRLVAALGASPAADFAYSRMLVHPHGYEVGSAPPAYGCLDSSVLCHRAGLPQRLGSWPAAGRIDGADQHAPDWGLVAAWLAGGARWAFVDAVTVDYYARDGAHV